MKVETVTVLLIAPVLMAVFGSIYFRKKDSSGKGILAFKALATAMPVLLSLYAALQNNGKIFWLICGGAFLCMCADVLLELHFVTGAAVFGAGHICYIAAFVTRVKPDILTAAVFVILIGGMLLLHGRNLSDFHNKLVPAILYALLLCFMAAMAVTILAEEGSPAGIVTALGGIAFFLSDNILVKCKMAEKRSRLSEHRSTTAGAWLLFLYYLAVYLITAGLYV